MHRLHYGLLTNAVTRKGAMAAAGYGRQEVTPYLEPRWCLLARIVGAAPSSREMHLMPSISPS